MAKKTVCVDLDGVLADYSGGWQGIDHIGDPIPGAVEFTKALAEIANVVIYTTRTNQRVNEDVSAILLETKIQEWLDKHGFAWTDIYSGQGKPLCAAFVDDRNVICRPQTDEEVYGFDRALAECRALCNGTPLGATGKYTDGKINDSDEGEVRLSVGVQNDLVCIAFGKPVAWLALPKAEAIQLGQMILKHARNL